MRYVFDPVTGADVTATVYAAMMASSTVQLADTFWIKYRNPTYNNNVGANLYLTSSSYPIQCDYLQETPGPNGVSHVTATFLTALGISRSAMSYEVGLKDQTVDVTWLLDDTQRFPVNTVNADWGWKWALESGYMDNCPVWIHRAIFLDPDPAAPALVPDGTTLMFRGFIKSVKPDRAKIVITLSSLMDQFQLQVPSQVITPGSRFPPFAPAGNADIIGGSLGAPPDPSSTPTDIKFNVVGVADHSLCDSFILAYNDPPPLYFVAHNGVPMPAVFRIRDNVTTGGFLHLYPFEPIDPIDMIAGGSGYVMVFSQYPIDGTTGTAQGFDKLPPVETGV